MYVNMDNYKDWNQNPLHKVPLLLNRYKKFIANVNVVLMIIEEYATSLPEK